MISPELLRLIGDLRGQRGFSFLDPWVYSSKSIALVVPITRSGYGVRRYVLLDEVPGAADVRDTGSIRRLMAENRIDKPVFVRSGCILEGKTQPRAVRFGVVIEPSSSRELEVMCVDEAEPIRRDAHLTPTLDTPYRLMYSLLEGDQHRAWDEIRRMRDEAREYALCRDPSAAALRLSTALSDISRELEKLRAEITSVIEKFPSVKDQVGVAIIDIKGVYAIELFDHPDSWRAIAKNAGRKFAEILAEEQEEPIFKPDPTAIPSAIRKFLDKIESCNEKTVAKASRSYTKVIEGQEVIGEYTALDSEVIHLMAMRRAYKPKAEEYIEDMHTSFRSSYTRPRPSITIQRLASLTYAGRSIKTVHDVLKALKNGGKTWSELQEKLRETISPATLDRRLKDALTQGLITKNIRENGKTIYELTAKGHALLNENTTNSKT